MTDEEFYKKLKENDEFYNQLDNKRRVEYNNRHAHMIHDPIKRQHRTMEKVISSTLNKLDKTNAPKIPTEVMHTYLTMYLDNERDERFILDVALQTYNKGRREPFTKEHFENDKYRRHTSKVGKMLERLKEHPLVVEMDKEGIWNDSYFKKSRGFSEMLTYVKRTLESWEKYQQVKEENEKYRAHVLSTEMALINLKAQHKEITEPQRKQELIRLCKREGFNQVETAEMLEIGIATVRRKWNQ